MSNRVVLVAFIAAIGLTARADDDDRLRAVPFVFVGKAGDCGPVPGSNIVTSAWLRGMGMFNRVPVELHEADPVVARREGLVSLESDIEEPEKSPILSKNSAFIKNHHVMQFFCDTMRMAVSGTRSTSPVNFIGGGAVAAAGSLAGTVLAGSGRLGTAAVPFFSPCSI